MALFHLDYIKNYKDFGGKSNKKSYLRVFPFFAKNLSISQDGNYR